MITTRFAVSLVVLVLSLAARPTGATGELQAEGAHASAHEHLTEVACVDVPPGEKRPEFGCFNIGTVKDLGSREAAEAAGSATGIVVEEDGRVWLSEFGARDSVPRGGEAVAVVGRCSFQ